MPKARPTAAGMIFAEFLSAIERDARDERREHGRLVDPSRGNVAALGESPSRPNQRRNMARIWGPDPTPESVAYEARAKANRKAERARRKLVRAERKAARRKRKSK
jgi:hypothetical protein